MISIGIDPGLTGAIAVIGGETGNEIELFDMPTSAKLTGKGQQLNLAALHFLLHDRLGEVWLEQVGPMPGQGVTSMFGFGRTVGQIEGIVSALGLPVQYVTPQRWKRPLGLIGRDKDAARTLAIQRFPAVASMLARKKDCGRADALLIAYHGWTQAAKKAA